MNVEIVQVDAFTDRPFAGNPAAVCIMERAADPEWMQAVALEMNLSETAFLYPSGDGYNLRWFTPAVEVELCGHATLASAYVLFHDGHVAKDHRITFHTASGALHATFRDDRVSLDFPALETTEGPVPDDLAAALRNRPARFAHSKFDCLAEFESEATVRDLTPDFGALKELGYRGIIVTAKGADYDFVSRFFAPAAGIDEDPVTGSAHCVLGPYWQKQLGKSDFRAFQASRRGGTVYVSVQGERIKLSGAAVITLRGTLLVGPRPK